MFFRGINIFCITPAMAGLETPYSREKYCGKYQKHPVIAGKHITITLITHHP
jgi:hypothetical protein